MSITRSVLSFRSAGRATLVGALLLAAPLAGRAAPAGARPETPGRRTAPAPAPVADNTPLARIAALTAVVDDRSRALDAAVTARDDTRAQLQRAQLAENLALARADELGRAAIDAQQRYEVARGRAGAVAASVYRNAGEPQTLLRLLDSKSVSEYGYRKSLADRVGVIQSRIVHEAVRTRTEAVAAAAEADRAKVKFHRLVADLEDALPRREQAVVRAQDHLSNSRFWLSRWESVALGVATPIMSRSVLSGAELAQWFTGTRRRARITVPMEELAQDYVDEGTAAGVRGDIAFAQSILETGSFFFPDGGQLTPVDNNFAGINACDSCPHGSPFPDARTGVRAQMQLLRVYADADFTAASLSVPVVLGDLDHHFLKGRVTTWNQLTHTWATADTYGDRILSIYEGILGWLTDRADL
jgi:hypothetical protein